VTIFIYRDNQQYGPYTLEDVRRYAAQGLIVPSDLARDPGMTASVTVASLLGSAEPAVSGAIAEAPKPPGVGTRTPGNVFTWPFHQDRWWDSLWMPLLWWIPIFGTLISFGWSIGVIRRRARRQPELPRSNDLGTVLKDGFVVALMSIVYFVIPSLLSIVLIEYKLFAVAWNLVKSGWVGFIFNPGKVLWMIAERGALESLLAAGIIPVFCLLLAWPFFVVGELHYAITGKIRSFLNVFGNLALLFRHFGGFLSYLFFVFLVRLALYGLSSLLTPVLALTVIFAVVAFVVPPVVAHWITAHLAGTLAREIYDDKRG